MLGACQLPNTLPPAADYITVKVSAGENMLIAPSLLVEENKSAMMTTDGWAIKVSNNHSVEVLSTNPTPEEELVVDVNVTNVGELQFEKMKTLAGEWEAIEGDFASPMITYEVSSGGHSIIERLFPGEEYEMVSMYHMQDGRLAMTHYCSMGNQPFLIAEPSVNENIVFTFISLGNMKEIDELHINGLEMVFHNENEITAHWSNNAKDAPASEARASFHVRRIN